MSTFCVILFCKVLGKEKNVADGRKRLQSRVKRNFEGVGCVHCPNGGACFMAVCTCQT